mgnify:CR=1 FL=1
MRFAFVVVHSREHILDFLDFTFLSLENFFVE